MLYVLSMALGTFEVCLLAAHTSRRISELRARLESLSALPSNIIEFVDVSYCDASDDVTLRFCFSERINREASRSQLFTFLGDSGLELVILDALRPYDRARFENQLRDQIGLRVRRSPSPAQPAVLPEIIDCLEEHLARALAASPRHATEIDLQPSTALRSDDAPAGNRRASTLEALDLIISDLPLPPRMAGGSSESIEIFTPEVRKERDDLPTRMETFGALDDMIAALTPY